MINYSNFLCFKHKYDQAITYGKKALALMDFGMGHHVLANAYCKKGENLYWNKNLPTDSKECFLTAIRHEPTNAAAYYGLGMSYYSLGYPDKDISLLKQSEAALAQSLELDPNLYLAQDALDKVRQVLKRIEH
jgi:tetratricopeptide (TPR) repeat protein